MSERHFTFIAGETGAWRIDAVDPVIGETLARASAVDVVKGLVNPSPASAAWALRGVTSNERYVTRKEHDRLVATQPPLGRPSATCAALIPIKKSDEWWQLSQDERRHIFEEQSSHIATGLRYLPAVARRLHHCRDLGEPFDFLTWFEYAPSERDAFEQLVFALRASEEWKYVLREVDVRLHRA